MSFKSSLNSFFKNDRTTLVFSIIAAIIVWFGVSIIVSPIIEDTVANVPVNISLDNSAFVGLKAFGGSDSKVDVTIQGQKYITNQINSDDIVVTANASQVLGPGIYTLELTARKASGTSDFDILSISPSTIIVKVDYENTKELDVEINSKGAVAAGEDLVLQQTISDSAKKAITITGADSEIKTIAKAVAVVEVNASLSQTTAYTADIKLYDAANNELNLTNVTMEFTQADVIVSVKKSKELPITVSYKNAPKDLPSTTIYEDTGSASTKVDTIKVLGDPDTIEAMTELSIGAVDFSTLNLTAAKWEYEFLLPTISGVEYPDYSSDSNVNFTVSIDNSNVTSKVLDIPQSNITFTNLGEGLTATAQSALKGVKIASTSSTKLKRLDAEDITVVVNVANLESGSTHALVNVTFIIKDFNSCWVIGTYTVTVKIS